MEESADGNPPPSVDHKSWQRIWRSAAQLLDLAIQQEQVARAAITHPGN
jgi:hypothetical protein